MKIAFFLGQMANGGAQRVISILASQFVSHGNDVSVLTVFETDHEYELGDKIQRIVLDSHKKKRGFVATVSHLVALRKIIKRDKYNVLISFLGGANYHAVLATRFTKTKCIISVRNDPAVEYPGRIHRLLARNLLPMAEGCVFQTEDAKKWFPPKLRRKSEIIPNPIGDRFFKINRAPQKGLIVSCGRLEKQKNQELLIEAFSMLEKEDSDLLLHIYGSGSRKEYLQKIVRQKQLENKVLFQGRIDDVAEALSKAYCFVLPSNVEGMPNALMEAMAVGLPCVSTDCPCGGPRFLIKNGENGILVPVKDVVALKNAIQLVLASEPMANELGSKARKRAESFSEHAIFQRWMFYIKEVLCD